MSDSNKNICVAITRYLKKEVKQRNANCVVVGISGGIDSAVVVSIAVMALGRKRVFGLILPDSTVTPKIDTKHAIDLATRLDIQYEVIRLDRIRRQALLQLPKSKLASGNLLARLRMAIIYYYATVLGGIVLGTSDKSEIMLGYFTKYGDGAADLFPIADLYKTQVRSLASFITIPKKIINKKSGARLWRGHTAKGELGLDYEEIDIILDKFTRKVPVTNNRLSQQAAKIKLLIQKNKHKHELPSICTITAKSL